MKVLRPKDKGYKKSVAAALNRRLVPDPKVRGVVAKILSDIEAKGDAALLRYAKKFGGPSMTPAQIPVAPAETARAIAELDPDVRRAISAARANVRNFARRSLRKSWFMKNRQGAVVGERFDPFQRVGIYVPGGTAPLVSSAIMTCTLAAAAGVPEIVAVTPAGKSGGVHPALLAALAECGATEIYRVGGAQAIAALACGTKTIRPVQKIFGPGNAFVVEAKRQVFGRVAVDLLPGPSEVLVIADKTANPKWIAADLLAQSEHGHGSQSILVTDSPKILSAVEKALGKQTKLSQRPKALGAALKNATLVLVPDMDAAVKLANDYAAEHVSIATARPGEIALRLTTTGAIFLGGLSPVVGGDFLAGPSHELPTGGAGKSFAGLTADQFQRRTSIVMFDEPSLRASLPYLETFSAIEGLDAHGRSASIRLEK
ncbi:MAG: histidinol dehydrogenase [Verrucomicrobiaceae bacterium]|nr:MAG: histidinol dehydrogenase [Verrucomicrobiaceae bacterium]